MRAPRFRPLCHLLYCLSGAARAPLIRSLYQSRQLATQELHPEGTVLENGYLRVAPVHRIYYEVYGNPTGPAAVVLNGFQGSSSSPALASKSIIHIHCFSHESTPSRRLFDLTFWKVVLVDSRGSGRSLPPGLLFSNSTQSAVSDVERLRYHLGIENWMILGGSYGATLALCYAQEYTTRVTGLLLRSLTLMQRRDLDWWFTPTGVAAEIPHAWKRFMSILNLQERQEPIQSYYNKMLCEQDPVRTEAARYWREWTMATVFPKLPPSEREEEPVRHDAFLAKTVNPRRYIKAYFSRTVHNVVEEILPMPASLNPSLIEAHFYYNNAEFIKRPYPLLERIQRIRGMPCVAIHGSNDRRCLQKNAWRLKPIWRTLNVQIVEGGGHCQFDPRIRTATMQMIETMKQSALERYQPEKFHGDDPLPTYQHPEPFYKKKYR